MLEFYFIFALVASYPLSIFGLIPVECVHKEYEECDMSLLPHEFPTTVDQLRSTCRDLKKLSECTLKVYESCMEDVEELGGMRKFVGYIHETCNEDNEVFQVISGNIQCIGSNARSIYESCHALSFSDPTKELITNLYEYANKSQIETEDDQNWCLENLWEVYCPSTKVGVFCGFEAGAAVKDMLFQTVDEEICSEEFVAEITPMLEVVELAIVEEEILKKMEEQEEKVEEPPEDQTRRKRRFAPFF